MVVAHFTQQPDDLDKLREEFRKKKQVKQMDDNEADWRQIQILLDVASSSTSSYKKFCKFLDTENLSNVLHEDNKQMIGNLTYILLHL